MAVVYILGMHTVTTEIEAPAAVGRTPRERKPMHGPVLRASLLAGMEHVQAERRAILRGDDYAARREELGRLDAEVRLLAARIMVLDDGGLGIAPALLDSRGECVPAAYVVTKLGPCFLLPDGTWMNSNNRQARGLKLGTRMRACWPMPSRGSILMVPSNVNRWTGEAA